MTIYFLVCPDTIDEELIDAIRTKKNLSDLVTDGNFSSADILGGREQSSRQSGFEWDPSPPDPDAAL